MQSGLIEDDHGVGARLDMEGNVFEMNAHCLAFAAEHYGAGTLALSRTTRTEDLGRRPPLIARNRVTRTGLVPAPYELGLLAHPGFILASKLYGRS